MEIVEKMPTEVESISQGTHHVAVSSEGISILIPMDTIQKSFQDYLNAIISDKSSYNNPVKKVVDDLLSGYSDIGKEVRVEFKKLVETQMRAYMATPGFHLQLGQAMAEEMAKEAVKKLNK